MIEVNGLTKRYGPFTAVSDVSFHVGEGEILGFIGPNGAGKTTTMRILTAFLPATEGTAKVAGFDVFESPMEVKRRVGYLPETPPLYRELTIGQYLAFVAELRGVSRGERFRRIGEVMEQVGLTGWERRIIGSLSKGYRQRVGIAQAMIHDPAVLILDEPTSGLDPAQTAEVRELMLGLAGSRTVILSTHILREVEAICERVVMINKGSIAAQGPMDEVRARAAATRYEVEIAAGPDQPDVGAREIMVALGRLESVESVEPGDGERAIIIRPAADDPRPEVAALAVSRGWKVFGLRRVVPTLEEAFLQIVRGS
jgi:ABC-2 type transport system ATP-binding protein